MSLGLFAIGLRPVGLGPAASQNSAPSSVSVSAASLALTGGNVGMRVSRSVGVQPAAMSLAQGAVSLKAARQLNVQAGSLAIAIGSVAVKATRTLSVQPAALNVGGSSVAVKATRRLPASVAALSLSHSTVTVRAGRRVRVAPSAFTLTGSIVQFEYTPAVGGNSYQVAVEPAVLILTGGDAKMRVSRRLPAAPAFFSLTGQGVQFLVSGPGAYVDASKIAVSRVVIFGGGSRVVTFGGGMRTVTFGGGMRVVTFDIPWTGQSKGENMTNAPEPYFENGKWIVDKDPDEQSYYVANLTKELTDRATTIQSVAPIVEGVEILVPPEVQGNFVVIKLGGFDTAEGASNFWTCRVTCANGERFDRTMYFNQVDN